MKEKDNLMESMANTFGDEFMRAMLGDIQKNTNAIIENNGQIAQVNAKMEELVKIGERPAVSPKQIEGLRAALLAHAAFFETPLKKEIHHKHFLGLPVVVMFLMGCLVVACVAMTVVVHERAEQYSASDIKFRSIKLMKDSVLLREVFATERQFEENPDQFRRDVVTEEERREALTERLLELNEKKAEVEKLEQEGKEQKK